MSLTKRIWIERDPTYASVREQFAKEACAHVAEFTFRIATRRANRLPGRRWDPFWPSALQQALAALSCEGIWINDGVFLRTKAERDAVFQKAAEIAEINIERMKTVTTRSSSTPRTRRDR